MKTDSNYKPPQDFLQVLMEAKYRDGNTLTITEITGILIGILLGELLAYILLIHVSSGFGETHHDRNVCFASKSCH